MSIEAAWDFIRSRFFDERTKEFYDFLKDDVHPASYDLPTPGEIAADSPNPCGWGTGMEDATLTAGSVLDLLAAYYRTTGDRSVGAFFSDVLDGMLCCAEDENAPGFVARALSPADGKSHYSDSSRDQYTHFVYGAMRAYETNLISEGLKCRVRVALSAIADKCERDVTPENGYELLRADGGRGIVSRMWGELGKHEYLRLPMIYLAVFTATGNDRYRALYLRYRDEGLDRSEGHVLRGSCYTGLQMQYSLRFLYDHDAETRTRTRILPMMRRLADEGEARMRESAAKIRALTKEQLAHPYRPFRDAPEVFDMGTFGGKRYLNPDQNRASRNPVFYPVRDVGEAACLAALCPDRPLDPDILPTLVGISDLIDYRHHRTYAPLLLVAGYALCREKEYLIRNKEISE